jgi:undecaprenyl-diphosphatase
MALSQAVILAIVEGLTEFLPVSSTAHLVLAAQLLSVPQTAFVKSFEVIIQLGAILAVVVLYTKELSRNVRLWRSIFLAFVPSAVVGFVLYDFIKAQLLGNGLITALALIIGGGVFIGIDKLFRPPQPGTGRSVTLVTLSPLRLLAIGLAQSLAVVPGVSRSAASIVGGMLVGLPKTEAVKFSFFLAIPTMLAATTLDLYKSHFSFTQSEQTVLVVGFVGSFTVALVAIKSFVKIVQHYSFVPFGVYRIAVGLWWLFGIIRL